MISFFWLSFSIIIFLIILGIILLRLNISYKIFSRIYISSAIFIGFFYSITLFFSLKHLIDSPYKEEVIKTDTLILQPFDNNNEYIVTLNISKGKDTVYKFNSFKYDKDDYYIFNTKDSIFGINNRKVGIVTDGPYGHILIKQLIKKSKKNFIKDFCCEEYNELYIAYP